MVTNWVIFPSIDLNLCLSSRLWWRPLKSLTGGTFRGVWYSEGYVLFLPPLLLCHEMIRPPLTCPYAMMFLPYYRSTGRD